MRILITGGTGLIGTMVTHKLLELGHEVKLLSRNPKPHPGVKMYSWDIKKGYIDPEALKGTDAILHMAGESIAGGRWTLERKKTIIDSRSESIRLIYKNLSQMEHEVRSCVSSGAIGYYGDRSDHWMKEEEDPGTGFLSESCIEWEKAVQEGNSLGLRIAQIRVGMVLSRSGGALKPLETLTGYFLASPLGKGNQWMSWIHIEDMAEIFIEVLENSHLSGIFNAVSPHPVTNQEFTHSLAKAMHKPIFLPPVPSWVLKMVLGEMAHVVLDSTRVSSKKTENTGFQFSYRNLDRALENLYTK